MYTVHPFWAKSKNINYKENHPQIDKTHVLLLGQWYVQASPFRPNVFRSNIQLTKPPMVTLRPRKLGILHSELAVFPGHFHVYIGHSERTCRVEHKDLDATHFQDSPPVMVNNAPRLFFWRCLKHWTDFISRPASITRAYGDIIYLQQLQTWTLGLRNSYQLSVLCPGVVAFISSEKQD